MRTAKTTEKVQERIATLVDRWYDQPYVISHLKGDGSDRKICRIRFTDWSLIGVVNEDTLENQRFIEIGKLLAQAGVAVPEVYQVSPERDAYLQEDLGDLCLANLLDCWLTAGATEKILAAYQDLFASLRHMHKHGGEVCKAYLHADRMTLQTYCGDMQLFAQEFVRRFQLQALLTTEVSDEISQLCTRLGQQEASGFVSRDFQARNIMYKHNKPYIIDFQSAKLGPEYYDLASLLYAGKSGLTEAQRSVLISEYFEQYDQSVRGLAEVKSIFFDFVMHRRLRSFGSYGYLGGALHKVDFLKFIMPALQSLQELLEEHSLLSQFPALYHALQKMQSDTRFTATLTRLIAQLNG